ncbi:MAG: hypothetical protein KY461_04495 [Actinobacteria bacterium]|nr:hypothetical protein [Actinomycetota bacterium]
MIDASSLFLHVLAATGLVGGGIVQVLAGTRVRTARTGRELASWAGFARQAGLLIAGSAVLSLLTGGHLAGAVWTTDARSGFSYPFITLGVIGLVLLAPAGPMLGGPRLRRLVAEGNEIGDAGLPAALRAEAGAPSLWGPVHSLLGLGIGMVALMTYKPGWFTGAVVLLVTFALGWVGGAVVARTPPMPEA